MRWKKNFNGGGAVSGAWGEQFSIEKIFQNPAILMSFLSIKYRLSLIKYLINFLSF